MVKLERHFGSSFSDGENLGPHSCCRTGGGASFSDGENLGAHLCCRTGGGGQTDNRREIKDEAVDCDGCRNMGNSGKLLFRTYQY